MKNLIIALVLATLTACTSTPDRELTPEGSLALETSVRIAVRHYVVDHPQSAQRAANIRVIVARVQTVLTAESTVQALVGEVRKEIDRLNLSELDRADANDLLTLLAATLESQLAGRDLNSDAVVQISRYLGLILDALPA